MAEYQQEKLQRELQTFEVGDRYVTRPDVVSEGLLDSFVHLIGLTHPLFLSDGYAKGWGFKSRASTGILTFAFMMGLLFKAGLLINGVYMGTDKMRHLLPVFPGDMIRAEIEILDKRLTSKGDRFIIRYKWQVKNQDDQVVSEGENTCMFPSK